MRVAHFYHVWAEGAWAAAAQEHAQALEAANFPAKPMVGVTGPSDDRAAFKGWAAAHGWDVVAEADEGYEQVTLNAARAWALESDEATAVLYTHSKGARTDWKGWNSTWRREMTRRLVGEWRAVQLLLEQHETVGCCWKNSVEFPQFLTFRPISGWYAGNFWWATRDYLRKLPVLGLDDRMEAEAWIGMANPDVVDLLPGWLLHMAADGSVIKPVTRAGA